MILVESELDMRKWSFERKVEGKSIGFVPTMGYLHEGHLSLVDIAKQNADLVVVSIFVNPAQFGQGEDYETYPRDEERDLRVCRERGVDVVYFPPVEEMYPEGYSTYVEVERLGDHLCGASRPGHFRGVTTVVAKLFNTVIPEIAVFGQKDAQQARIIERMTGDLQFGIRIIVGSIIRESDGLAMSSRNVRLSPGHRSQAPVIFHGLGDILTLYGTSERKAGRFKEIFLARLLAEAKDGELDYIEVVDWETLAPVEKVESKALVAAAVRFSGVRLIDNLILE